MFLCLFKQERLYPCNTTNTKASGDIFIPIRHFRFVLFLKQEFTFSLNNNSRIERTCIDVEKS